LDKRAKGKIMDIVGLTIEEAPEGVIWHAWIDNKFVIDGYGYDDAEEAIKAIGDYTFDKVGGRLIFTGLDRNEPKKEKSK